MSVEELMLWMKLMQQILCDATEAQAESYDEAEQAELITRYNDLVEVWNKWNPN